MSKVIVEIDISADRFNQDFQSLLKEAASKADVPLKVTVDPGSTDEVQSALNQLVEIEKVEKLRQVFGDVKDIFEFTVVPLAGLSEKLGEVVVLAGDMAEKGAAAGLEIGNLSKAVFGTSAAFGGLLGVAGGLVAAGFGALAGVAKQNSEEMKKAQKQAEKTAKAMNDLADALERGADVSLKNIDKLIDKEGILLELELERARIKKQEAEIEELLGKSIDGESRLKDVILQKEKQILEVRRAVRRAQEATTESVLEQAQALVDSIDPQVRALDQIEKELKQNEEAAKIFLETYKVGVEAAGGATNTLINQLGLELINTMKARRQELEKELQIAKKINEEVLEGAQQALSQNVGRFGGALKSFVSDALDVAGVTAQGEETGKKLGSSIARGVRDTRSELEKELDFLISLGEGEVPFDGQAFADEFATAKDALSTDDLLLLLTPQIEIRGLEQALPPLAGLSDEISQIEDLTLRLNDTFANVANSGVQAFSSAVGDSFGQMFENIQQGERLFAGVGKTFAKAASEFLKSTGTQMIADGVFNVLKGTAMTILGNPGQGAPLIALGGIEIATGAAMGGVGALAGRAGADTSGSATGAGAGEGGIGGGTGSTPDEFSTQQLADVNVFLGPREGTAIISGEGEQAKAEIGLFVKDAIDASNVGGPLVFNR